MLHPSLFQSEDTPFEPDEREAIYDAVVRDGVRGLTGVTRQDEQEQPVVGLNTVQLLNSKQAVHAQSQNQIHQTAERAHAWAGRHVRRYVAAKWPEDQWETVSTSAPQCTTDTLLNIFTSRHGSAIRPICVRYLVSRISSESDVCLRRSALDSSTCFYRHSQRDGPPQKSCPSRTCNRVDSSSRVGLHIESVIELHCCAKKSPSVMKIRWATYCLTHPSSKFIPVVDNPIHSCSQVTLYCSIVSILQVRIAGCRDMSTTFGFQL